MIKQFILKLWMLLLILLTSCAKYYAEEEDEEETNQQTVCTLHVNPRAGDEIELDYPINIYAFDSDGNYVGEQIIQSSEGSPSIALSLSKGSYRIVALSGATEKEYKYPSHPTLTDLIEIKQGCTIETPLMMGNADVTLKGETAKANITLNFMVAQLKIVLSNIPKVYSNVEVEIASFYSNISFNCNYTDGKHNAIVPCSKNNNGEWETGIFYTFEGSQQKTIISIHLTKDGETETYAYTYNKSILANHPFILKGNYAKSISVEGNIIAGNWADATPIDFTFGKGNGNENPDDENNDSNEENPNDSFTVEQIPEEESIWKDCLVLEVTPTNQENEADILLMGIDNATNNEGKEKMLVADAFAAIDTYSSPSISDWRIPTKEEAQLLKSRYNSNLTNINQILSDVGGTELVVESPRYLCNDAMNSFNFKSGTISLIGKKTLYYLRPVKTVHVIKR